MAKTTLQGTGKTGKSKTKFHKTHPERTQPSNNRTDLQGEYPGPNPLGYGTPIVLIWDKQGRLILDLIPVGKSYYEIALMSFTYEFKEKEEDQCTIVFSCNTLDLMDNMDFFQGQFLLVSWGYADGNLRPPLKVVVVDTKEKYNEKGFQLTLVCSDNLSFFSRTKTALQASLETSQANIRKMLSPGAIDLETGIKMLEGWRDWDYGNTANLSIQKNHVVNVGPIESTAKFPRESVEEQTEFLNQLSDYYRRKNLPYGTQQPTLDSMPAHPTNINADFLKELATVYDVPPEAIMATEKGKLFPQYFSQDKEGKYHSLTEGITPGPTSDDPPPYPEHQPNLPQEQLDHIATLPYALTGYHITVSGKNAQSLAKNTLDTISPYPMEVVGRDGKMVTYNKDRAVRARPVKEYIFKAGKGYFLEFTYDSNAKYSDDSNVLRNFSVDPKTGAITQKDMINSKDKVVDVQDPVSDYRAQFQRDVTEKTENLLINDPNGYFAKSLATSPQFAKFSGKTSAGDQVLVAYDKHISTATKAYETPNGGTFVQDTKQAVDGTAVYVPVMANITQDITDFAEVTLENGIKNLMRGEQERVKAKAKLLGDPQMVSGVKVTFLGLAKRRCGNYFLTGCVHTIDQGGYIMDFEMYFVGDISNGVNTIKTTTSKDKVTDKANSIKDKKISQHTNSTDIKNRGYYLKTDFLKEEFELAAEKVDREWNVKMPGMFYKLSFNNSAFPEKSKIVIIKIPANPDGSMPQDPLKAFGYEALYDLLGCHDQMRVFLDTKMEVIGDRYYGKNAEMSPVDWEEYDKFLKELNDRGLNP